MNNVLKKFLCVAFVFAMVIPLAACGSGTKDTAAEAQFPAFKAQDFSGKEYTESIFSENEATVVNFWFTDCRACVGEMPDLEKLSSDLAAKKVKLVGFCTDAVDEIHIAQAEKILEANQVNYTNFKATDGEEIGKFINSIVAYPTTYVVDKNGKIAGDPIVGALNSDDQMKRLNETIDKAIKDVE